MTLFELTGFNLGSDVENIISDYKHQLEISQRRTDFEIKDIEMEFLFGTLKEMCIRNRVVSINLTTTNVDMRCFLFRKIMLKTDRRDVEGRYMYIDYATKHNLDWFDYNVLFNKFDIQMLTCFITKRLFYRITRKNKMYYVKNVLSSPLTIPFTILILPYFLTKIYKYKYISKLNKKYFNAIIF